MPDNGTGQIGVWLNERDKADLEELAYQRRSSMSEITRKLVKEELDVARRTGEIDDVPDEATAQN